MATTRTRYWLFKSEPDTYRITDLARDGTAMWEGVRNYQARNFIRDEMKVGEKAIFYHSNAGKQTGAVGLMRIVRAAYPDPTQFDPQSEYYDQKANADAPRWYAVDVAYVATFAQPVTLAKMRDEPALREMKILQLGSRLSVTPLTKREYERVAQLGTQLGD